MRHPWPWLVLALSSTGCAVLFRDPVSPPSGASRSATPRYDGVYAAKVEGKDSEAAWDLLRFTADGRVLGVSSTAPPESAIRPLYDKSDVAAVGMLENDSGILRFTLKSKLGAVEYAGAIRDDNLVVRWKSSINDRVMEQTYSFVHVDAEQKSPGKPTESSAPVALAPPDPNWIPEGSGWVCFRAPPNQSRCERTQAACEAAYKEASATDLKLTKCARQPTAFCHTVMEKASGKGLAYCYVTEDECKAGVADAMSSEHARDFQLSSCAKR